VNKLVTWAKAKFGRLVTAIGGSLFIIDGFDISSIKGPLTDLIGATPVKIIICVCFVASFVRHQYIASQAGKPSAPAV
jgi:hypothetical protein